jgi:ABC-type bacteriocin/lantibiotic exporter with double-glycine peptidase domain
LINFLLMSFCVFTVGSWQIMHDQITLGTLIAFLILLFNFNAPIYNLVRLTTEIQAVIAKIFRVEDVLHYSSNPEPLPTSEKNFELSTKLKGRIELQDITFGYTQNNALLLENFNLSTQPGQWLGIVGASGSGKTTLIKLIIGSEKPWSGRILMEGILVNSLAVVYHQPFLFQESVIDNITMRDHSISLERVIQAAKLSCIHDHINTRAEKYHTVLDQQGNNFSVGEQQQIDIARALINNPAVLILDEATACLDPLTERKIWENIRQLFTTGIIVTNQSSLLKNCNEIIILEKGKIIERGHYANLADLSIYKEIAAED